MTDNVYDLANVPFSKAATVRVAVKQYIDEHQPTGANLHALIQQASHAIDDGQINSAKAQIPCRGIEHVVDLATFSDEMREFVAKHTDYEPIKLEAARRSYKQLGRNVLSMMVRRSSGLRIAEKFCRNPLDYWRIVCNSHFTAQQRPVEIRQLLNLLHQHRPKDVLEIGTANAGTIYLFARMAAPNATLATCDLSICNPEFIASFARRQQTVHSIQGDSTSSQTQSSVRVVFPSGVDFLFIDGDHSYEGVKKDFELYHDLVRPGGLIAFHDIVPDNETRYGVLTGGWAGGVPKFWKEVKQSFEHQKFIQNIEQDGLGIGVIQIPK